MASAGKMPSGIHKKASLVFGPEQYEYPNLKGAGNSGKVIAEDCSNEKQKIEINSDRCMSCSFAFPYRGCFTTYSL